MLALPLRMILRSARIILSVGGAAVKDGKRRKRERRRDQTRTERVRPALKCRPPEESTVNRAEDRTPCGRSCFWQPGLPGFLLQAGHLWPAVPAPGVSGPSVAHT